MKIDVRPNLDQIRFFAEAALHAWDFQDLETGRAQVIADMTALLDYLTKLDDGDGVAVARIIKIESGLRLEEIPGSGQILDLRDRYMEREASIAETSDGEAVSDGLVNDIRTNRDREPSHREFDLGAPFNRRTQK